MQLGRCADVQLTTRSDTPTIPYAQTHPDRLATVAALHGLRAARSLHARACWRSAAGRAGTCWRWPPRPRASGRSGSISRASRSRRAARRSPRSGSRTSSCARATSRELTDGELGEFDYIDRPRRLRLDSRPTPRRAAGRDPRVTWRRTASRYVSYNAEPGGYFRQHAARRGAVACARRARARRRRPRRRRSCTGSSRSSASRHADT